MASSPSRPDRRPPTRLFALLTLATLAGCGAGEGPDSRTSGPKGADTTPVVVDGSSTVFRISRAAQEEFAKVDEQVEVVVRSSGTGGGFTKYLQDEVDIVDASRAAKPEEEAKANMPQWQLLMKNCDEAAGKSIGSGYQGEDWANATLDLALCGKVLKKPAYSKASLRYMQALVDDHDSVGDKKGGDKVARDDDGYAIRNRGFMAAIAYDWLHDDPAMTDEIKKHMIGRFYAFNTWYKKEGYRKDEPWSNHFMGWFASVGMAGVATDGDDAGRDRGAEMRRMARDLWTLAQGVSQGFQVRNSINHNRWKSRIRGSEMNTALPNESHAKRFEHVKVVYTKKLNTLLGFGKNALLDSYPL